MRVSACTSVCVSFIAGQTVGPNELKFGMVVLWVPGSVLGGLPPTSEAVKAAGGPKKPQIAIFGGKEDSQRKVC